MLLQLVGRLFGYAPHVPSTSVEVQRRQSVRLQCSLPAECVIGSARVCVDIIDVSDGGVRLEVPVAVTVNTTVSIRYVGRLRTNCAISTVRGRVTWVHRVGDAFHAGILFDDEPHTLAASWVLMILRRLHNAARLADDRKQIRVATDLEAGLRMAQLAGDESKPFRPGRILDLSAGGALFEGATYAPLNSSVQLQIVKPSLCLPAIIVRRPGPSPMPWKLGLRFDTLSDGERQELESLLTELLGQWRTRIPRRTTRL